MKPYEFKRMYHPRLGRFVYKHKGSGIIVDNIFKPLRKVASNILKMAKPIAEMAKPVAKKAIKSEMSKASEKNEKKSFRKSWRSHNEKTIIDENQFKTKFKTKNKKSQTYETKREH